MKKVRRSGEGLKLMLFCSHQASNLWKQTVSRPNRRTSGWDAMNKIVAQLNKNKGSADPTIEIVTPFDTVNKLGNKLDQGTANDYIFESVKMKRAVDEIIDREGNPVEMGGSFQFNYFRFKSKYNHATHSDLDTVYLQVFPQGFMDNGSGELTNIPQITLTKPTLESAIRANTLILDSDLEIENGTNLIAIGNKGAGTYPTDYAKFLGAKQVFENAQFWKAGRFYPVGTLSRYPFGPPGNVATFECITAHTALPGETPPSTLGVFWVGALTFSIKPTWSANPVGYTRTFMATHNEIAYQCAKTHQPSNASNEPPNDEFWHRSSWPPISNYSPLTKGKAQYWINALGGAKYAATEAKRNKPAMIDPSVVVKDRLHPRTWVDCVTNDSTVMRLKTDLMKNGLEFDTFRVLCVDPSTGIGSIGLGDFSGNDPNNEPLAGNIIEYRDPDHDQTGDWYVFKPNQVAAQIDQEVYDYEEGDSWTNQPCKPVFALGLIADRGVNAAGECRFSVLIGGGIAPRSTIWEKGSYGLSERWDEKMGVWFEGKSFECVHSIRWDEVNGRIACGNEQLGKAPNDLFEEYGSENSAVFIESSPLDLTAGINPFYVGLNFAFPFPRTKNNIPYAGSVTSIGEQIDLESFDLDNMDRSAKGNRTWYGPEVEDLYPIQDFTWFQYFREQALADPWTGISGPKLEADYSMALFLQDRNDTTIVIEYVHTHNDITIPISTPITKQKIYRAIPGISYFVPGQAPEILDIFDWRNVVRGGIYTRDSFDEQNRYKTLLISRFGLASGVVSDKIHLSIDAFRMTKPLVVTNADEFDARDPRNIEPQKFQIEKITNYAQAKNYILSQAAVSGFRTDRYDIQTPGRINVAWGDPVYYFDPEAVEDTTNGLINTVRGTATKINYTLSKGVNGPGGFIRAINIATRLYPDDNP